MIKQQLQDVGVVGTLTLLESGEQITLNFPRGKLRKQVLLTLDGAEMPGTLIIQPLERTDGPDITLVLEFEHVPKVKVAEQLTVTARPAPPPEAQPEPPLVPLPVPDVHIAASPEVIDEVISNNPPPMEESPAAPAPTTHRIPPRTRR